jgi:hypothetical protein
MFALPPLMTHRSRDFKPSAHVRLYKESPGATMSGGGLFVDVTCGAWTLRRKHRAPEAERY